MAETEEPTYISLQRKDGTPRISTMPYNELLNKIRDLESNVSTLYTRYENSQNQLDSLIFLLKPQVKERIRTLFLRYIAKNLDFNRSYRSLDIGLGFRDYVKLFWKFGHIINEVFDEAVKEGTIEARGSGWYRIKVHIGET